jgi:hypothetical protein
MAFKFLLKTAGCTAFYISASVFYNEYEFRGADYSTSYLHTDDIDDTCLSPYQKRKLDTLKAISRQMEIPSTDYKVNINSNKSATLLTNTPSLLAPFFNVSARLKLESNNSWVIAHELTHIKNNDWLKSVTLTGLFINAMYRAMVLFGLPSVYITLPICYFVDYCNSIRCEDLADQAALPYATNTDLRRMISNFGNCIKTNKYNRDSASAYFEQTNVGDMITNPRITLNNLFLCVMRSEDGQLRWWINNHSSNADRMYMLKDELGNRLQEADDKIRFYEQSVESFANSIFGNYNDTNTDVEVDLTDEKSAELRTLLENTDKWFRFINIKSIQFCKDDSLQVIVKYYEGPSDLYLFDLDDSVEQHNMPEYICTKLAI